MHFAYSYEQGAQLCSLHSLTHKRRSISVMFSSNKISQHNKLKHTIQNQHCSCTPQFLHTLKMHHVCHAQYSNYIATTHNINMHYTPTTTHIPLPLTTLLCTQLTNTKHICVSGSKMAQDVGMVCRCCGVIPILVWLVFEDSIPTCACFPSENFL